MTGAVNVSIAQMGDDRRAGDTSHTRPAALGLPTGIIPTWATLGKCVLPWLLHYVHPAHRPAFQCNQ